ncbi:hypothetical protein ABT369_54090 [Dactylosporangium sp. NPDC000244]|uniref:hypothetical protein n=1 Tax=Dactylosporangium sp. NPDC000244 TaxID=3154365 RepID=UPI00332209DE
MERFEPVGPVSGDEVTCGVVDAALTALAARRGLWTGDDRVMVHMVASLIDQARRCLPELVGELLAEGDCSWDDVARLRGSASSRPGSGSIRRRRWPTAAGFSIWTAAARRAGRGSGRVRPWLRGSCGAFPGAFEQLVIDRHGRQRSGVLRQHGPPGMQGDHGPVDGRAGGQVDLAEQVGEVVVLVGAGRRGDGRAERDVLKRSVVLWVNVMAAGPARRTQRDGLVGSCPSS